ncbi:DUF2254 domain-containing protein [Arenibaculum sp.]|uniref:DUF2254 domain-containing protein n=1 Tax=Arenibaculum sp. TaxID=2865862 RepID=UPI002E148010|nr:DUF2254 domain-containing protein [Arenibaculum sp.]
MFDRAFNIWDKLRTSLWFVPLVMTVLAVVLREVAVAIDASLDDGWALQRWWLNSGSGDDARNLLSTLVAALITMASVMFSITMVVLSLASNQYGSRLVRTYMSDLRTQLALGTFAMTIVYCLLILRTVEQDIPPSEVPHVSVTASLVLALVCIVTLLLFLHVVARSTIAEQIIQRVTDELEDSIERMLPALDGRSCEPAPEDVLPCDMAECAATVRSREEGYVQAIEYEDLAELAARHDVVIRLDFRAGTFMCKEGWLAKVHPAHALCPAIEEAIRENILIGARRTPTQDIEFSIRHLVDVALRALSPGINDPNTAIAVIDRLRGALARLMGKRLPSTTYRDEEGTVRVVGDYTGFGGIFDAAFHQIRQAGAPYPAVVIHLLRAIGRLAEHVRVEEQRDALLRHAGMIAAAGLRGLEEPRDRADIEEVRAAVEDKLRRTP